MTASPIKFGTDGIRGRAGEGALTRENVVRIAKAAGSYFKEQGAIHPVLIGKDTRLSGTEIEIALMEGLTHAGLDVLPLAVLPTPGTALITRDNDAAFGIMITASHNPHHDNGLKIFGPDGFKLSAEAEGEIKRRANDDPDKLPFQGARVLMTQNGGGVYAQSVTNRFKDRLDLSGLKIVLDMAHGAAFETAPLIFRNLGAKDLILIGDAPNGENINAGCGSTHPEAMTAAVIKAKADIGIAFDGDADRLIMSDETGKVIDGDQLLGRLATDMQARGDLTGGGIVATVMSNLGLERFLEGEGLTLTRTGVGDKKVAAKMREAGFNLGGEQSGHILLTDIGPSGDGITAALSILIGLIAAGVPASEHLSVFRPVPQTLTNVRYAGRSPMDHPDMDALIQDQNSQLDGRGRILIRASGTEPLIRIMVEADDPKLVKTVSDALAAKISNMAET